MKKPVTFILLLFFIIVVLSVVQIVVSNRLSTTGIALGKVQDQLQHYKTENSVLSEQLLLETSLTRLSEHAKQVGFIQSKNRVALAAPPLARRQ